jgi:hypothetical protein
MPLEDLEFQNNHWNALILHHRTVHDEQGSDLAMLSCPNESWVLRSVLQESSDNVLLPLLEIRPV